MVNVFEGIQDDAHVRLTFTLRVERDLTTGIMGMAQAVSYPACVAIEMLISGDISKKGILSPVTDIPASIFISRLRKRGIQIEEETVPLPALL